MNNGRKGGEMTDGQIDSLLLTLDSIAKDYDPYGSGLPIYAEPGQVMRGAVREWIAVNVPSDEAREAK